MIYSYLQRLNQRNERSNNDDNGDNTPLAINNPASGEGIRTNNKRKSRKTFFLKQIETVDKTGLSEQSRILIDLIERYQVKKMLNESLRNLLELCERKMEDSEV